MEIRLFVKIYKEDKFWVVEVPELQIATQGETLEEALENAKEMIEGYFETWPEELEKIKDGLITVLTVKIK